LSAPPELLGIDPNATAVSPPMLLTVPPETLAVIELIGRALAPDADDHTRAAARELWARFAQMIAMTPGVLATPGTPSAPMAPSAPVMPAMPGMPPAPMMPAAPILQTAPTMPPASILPGAHVMQAMPTLPQVPALNAPFAGAVRAMRQMSPDQLLDVVLGRLRAKLPAGATPPTPKGLQIPLVPVAPLPGAR
jgi:hypothetical protein